MNPAAMSGDLEAAAGGVRPGPTSAGRGRRRAAAVVLTLVVAFGLAVAGVNGWAEYHFRAARSGHDRFRLPEAQEHLNKCLRVWPDSRRVNFLAARTARRLGDLDAADRHLDRCQRGAAPADDVLAERLMIRAQRGEPDEVLPALRDLIQSDHPDAALMLEALARGYASLFRFPDLDAVLHNWLERDPQSTLAVFFRAWMREQMGPREEAVQDYRAVLARDPDNDEARLRLANLLLERSQPQEALEHLELLARHQPANLAVKVRLARSRHDLGDLDAARALLDDVLAREPDYVLALTARGRLALQLNQPDEAEARLRRAAELDRSDYQTAFLLHQALARQGKADEARQVRERLKSLEEDTRRLHEIVIRQLSQRPDDPELHVQAGEILLRSGQKREGLDWLLKALRIDPRYPRAHAELARYFEAAGDLPRAAHHRRLSGQAPPR